MHLEIIQTYSEPCVTLVYSDSETYSEPCKTSMVECFVKTVYNSNYFRIFNFSRSLMNRYEFF